MRWATRSSLLATAILLLGGNPQAAPEAPELPELLRGLDRASRLYLDTALRFTCDETITEPFKGAHKVGRFQYIFVHEPDGSLHDYRMKTGKGVRPEVDPGKLGFHHFLQRAYFWVLVFNGSRQKHFRYAALGEADALGVKAQMIRFEPIPPYREAINDWFGTAWVDPETFQILRVEAMKADKHENWERLRRDLEVLTAGGEEPAGRYYEIQTATTEFGMVKNGMRFPSRAEVVSSIYYFSKAKLPDRASLAKEERTLQTYKRYKFYGVRTRDEVRNMLHPGPIQHPDEGR
ncbi:MAG: hypothetical protein L0Z52_11655 [Acidobacteria bacterium]|nr:hypothetical protein [Acidobacteriota bacterium]